MIVNYRIKVSRAVPCNLVLFAQILALFVQKLGLKENQMVKEILRNTGSAFSVFTRAAAKLLFKGT